MTKSYKRILFSTLALLLGLLFTAGDASAMPMFARKLGVPCATCHTTIPQLNETGYKFRAAGFRLPEFIGKPQEAKFELGDYFSARAQARYDSQMTNQPNGAPQASIVSGVPLTRTTTNAFSFQEFTLYPLTGAWGKYFGSLAELSVSPEDFFEVENAYVRFVFGNEKRFFTSRVGIFHPWEGFGASDRPISNARPLFQTNPVSAGGRAIPYNFQPWGLDEAGIEIGADISKLSLRAAVLGGTFVRWEEDANAFLPFPAQTGPWKGANQAVSALSKSFDSVAHNTPDFSANATYLLHPNGGGVSLIYYRGNVATPTHCTNGIPIGGLANPTDPRSVCGVTTAAFAPPFGEPGDPAVGGSTEFDFTSAGGAFRNNFDRLAAYASYPIKRFLPMGGFIFGRDTIPNATNLANFPAVDPTLRKFDSKGAFADGSFSITQYLTAGLRYDWFKPRYGTGGFRTNTQWAITPYVNIPLQNGFQIIAEYQHRDFQFATTPPVSNHRQNDTFQARVIFIK